MSNEMHLDDDTMEVLKALQAANPGFTQASVMVMIGDRETLNGMKAIANALSFDDVQDLIIKRGEETVPWAVNKGDVEKIQDMVSGVAKFAEAKQK